MRRVSAGLTLLCVAEVIAFVAIAERRIASTREQLEISAVRKAKPRQESML